MMMTLIYEFLCNLLFIFLCIAMIAVVGQTIESIIGFVKEIKELKEFVQEQKKRV